jgi:hypothetical protein
MSFAGAGTDRGDKGKALINRDFQVHMMSLFKRASAISRHDVPEVCMNPLAQ